MALISTIDTYYTWVLKQMQSINPAFAALFKGTALSQDWPQLEIDDGEIWLLILNSIPIGGTKACVLYKHYLQWAWILLGDDIQADQQAANRGNRYREHLAVMEAFRQANYPGFAQKIDSSVDAVTGVVTLTPTNPIEMVQWSELKMPTRFNQTAGVVYGMAAVEVNGYDVIPSNVDNALSYPPPVPTT